MCLIPPFNDVAQYTMPVLSQIIDTVSLWRSQPMSKEWVALRCFFLRNALLCVLCACEELFSRMYPARSRKTVSPRPLSHLITPTVAPTVSYDDKTLGRTSDREPDDARWEADRCRGHLVASVCDSY